jgi:hypothetical protein
MRNEKLRLIDSHRCSGEVDSAQEVNGSLVVADGMVPPRF